MSTIPSDHFRLLFEEIPEAVLVTTPDGTVEAANPAACEMFGMTEAEICAAGRAGLIDPADLRQGELLERRRRAGKVHGELRHRRKDGSLFEGELTSFVVDDGKRSFSIVRDITARKRTEEKLSRAHEQARYCSDVLANSSQPFVAIYPDGSLMTSNAAFARLVGYTSKELYAIASTMELTSPEWLERHLLALERLLRTGEPQVFEKEYLKKGGGRVPVEMNLHIHRDEAGEVSFYYAFITDISERKRAEEEIRRFGKERDLALDAARMGWWRHDPATGLTAYDERYCRMFGIEKAERSVEDFLNSLHPDDLPTVKAVREAALDPIDPKPYMAEYRIFVDGAPRWIEAYGIATFEGEGATRRAVSLVGTVKDITYRKQGEFRIKKAYERAEKLVKFRTEQLTAAVANLSNEVEQRKETEAVLRKNEALLNTVLQTIPVGILITNAVGEPTFYNQAAADTWGRIAEGGVAHYGEYKAWWPETGEPLKPEELGAGKALLFGETVVGQVLEIETFDGAQRKTIVNSAAPIRDEEGRITGCVAIADDITNEIDLQKQLLHAQKLESIGALAGGVAHDFNNLLMVVCGFTEMVYAELEGEDDLQEKLLQVMQAGEKGRDLAQKLLLFSRRQVVEKKVLDLSAAAQETINFVTPLVGENVAIQPSLSTAPLMVRANPNQIDQVLMNLVVNARDAMPKGGTLTITTGAMTVDKRTASKCGLTAGAEYAFIKVADTGTGIPKKIADRIFEPYFTTKPEGQGTGLGLSIVHGIISQHNGGITVAAAAGKGTTFTIFLPLTKERTAAEGVAKSTLKRGRETILVVEDDAMVLSLMVMLLSRAGYRVMSAVNAFDALETVRSHTIDAVLSDVMMPGKDGTAMFAEMRKLKPGLKVVFASGYSPEIMNAALLDSRDCRFVQKPVSRQTLLQTMREVLDG